MRPKVKVKVAVVALVVTLLVLPGVSHGLTHDQQDLVGLKGVEVVIGEMNPQAERLGLTQAQIKTDVELRLRNAGVRVLTQKERLEMNGMPYLYLRVSTFVGQDRLVAYAVSVEVKERVTLARGFETEGAIWHMGSIGTVGANNIGQIRGIVVNHVDKFINDYLAANPKK